MTLAETTRRRAAVADRRYSTGPAKSGHHLVRNEQGAVCPGNVGGSAQPARWLRNHARRALHQRLKHKRRVGIPFFLLGRELLFNLADAFPMALPIFARVGAFRLRAVEWAAVKIRRHDLVGLEQQSGITPVK